MKKVIAFICAISLLFCFSACNKYIKNNGGDKLINNAIVRENDVDFFSFKINVVWSKQNRTYHDAEITEERDSGGYPIIVYDEQSAKTRTIYVTNEDEFEQVFAEGEQIDFNEEMIVLYRYTSRYSRKRIIENVYLENENIVIVFDTEDKSGIGGTCTPRTLTLALRIKNTWKNKVQFIYLSH